MRKLNVKLLLVFIGLGSAFVSKAQDPQFTQFYANTLYLSPSFAGAVKDSRMTASVRSQWTGITHPFNTYNVAIDHYFHNVNSGLGLLAFRDQAGSLALSTTSLGLLYSYNLPINYKWYVRPGAGFYYSQRSIDYADLVLGDQLITDGNGGSVSNLEGKKSQREMDFSASALLVGTNLWAGFALDHLLRPDRSLLGLQDRVPIKFSVHAGYRFVIKGYYLRPVQESITAAFNYKQQGDYKQFDMGLYWYKQPIMLGVWYRGIPIVKDDHGTDALAFLVGIKVPNFNIGYSYDMTLSDFGVDSGGAHEVSITYEFSTVGRKKWKAVPCPEF